MMHEHAYEPLISPNRLPQPPEAPRSNGTSDFASGRQEQWIRSEALTAAVAMAHHESMSGEDPWTYSEVMNQAVLFADYIRDGYVYNHAV